MDRECGWGGEWEAGGQNGTQGGQNDTRNGHFVSLSLSGTKIAFYRVKTQLRKPLQTAKRKLRQTLFNLI